MNWAIASSINLTPNDAGAACKPATSAREEQEVVIGAISSQCARAIMPFSTG